MMDSKGGKGTQPPPPPTPHIVQKGLGKVELCADVDATKADSDKKSYRLIKLPNGLRVLLVHDPPAAGSNGKKNTKGEGKRGSGGSDAMDCSSDDDDDDHEDDDSEGDEEGSCDDSQSGGGGEDGEGGDGDDEEPEGVKKAAAAMAVGVGNLSDPEHCQGLAHYLEHMLFMGSGKYPDENEYDSFISKSGGSSNAFTECEYTLYHFDVLPQHLEKALDVFAQFFVSPLMKADSSDRELQSIESEFCLSKNSDACRLQELWCHTSKRGHPYSKFCWGNMWSLRHEPQSKGVDVRQELIDFHAKHYRAPAMQLVVLGGQSLDELQDLAVESFSGVAAGKSAGSGGGGDGGGAGGGGGTGTGTGLPEESAAVAAAGLPFDASALGRAFRIQPVKDSHRLHVTWQLGEQHSLYKSKPSEYIGHLIGHEGEGSVLSLLRHKRWATGVSVGISGSGFNDSSCCATFCVTFYLTKAGVRHWLDIVDVLFCYIGMLRREGPQEWVFQEIRDVANIQYRFQEESEPAEYVEQLAEQMLPTTRYEDLHILKGPYVMEKWDPELMESILGQLTPSSARYDVTSSLFGRAVDAPSTKKNKQEEAHPLDQEGDETAAAAATNTDKSGGEKRGLKRAAATGGNREERRGDDDDDDEEDSEEGSEDGSEADDSEEDSEEDSGGEEEEEEEEEEGVDQGHIHALCKKPDHDPLEEPRFGLCFWNDAVPLEILEAWEASQQLHKQQKPGGSAARTALLSSNSSSSQECRDAAAPSNGTTNGMGTKIVGLQQKAGGVQVKDDGEPLPILALPKPNRFIPTEFDLKGVTAATTPLSSAVGDKAVAAAGEVADAAGKGDGEGGQLLNKHSPRKLVRESAPEVAAAAAAAAGAGGVVKLTMWHLQDRTFRQPRAEIYLKVVTPMCNESARSAALCELVVRLVNDSLTEYSYSAYVAELQYGLKATDAGFQIHVYGFDHKAPLMLREVLKRLLDLGPHLQEGPLSVQLEALIREYHNTDMKPGRHVSNVRLQALRQGRWSPGQKQAALTGVDVGQEGSEATAAGAAAAAAAAAAAVSLGDMQAFLKRLFHRVEMEGLVHGNFSEADAERVLDDVEKVAGEAAHSREERGGDDDGDGERGANVADEFKYPEEPVVRLDASQHVLYCCPSKDPTEQNCALEVYWQIGVNNLKQRVLADAIEQVMDEPLYDQLRTKEQLGYSVGCSPRITCGVLGFCVTAQSAAYGPAHLYARVRAFMTSFRDTLADMEEEAFLTNMESAAANKLQPDNTLSEEAQRHWPEIYSRRRAFHVNVAEAVEMRGLEKSAVLQAYEEWFSSDVGSKPCLTLTVTGGGKFSAEDEANAIQAKVQEEIDCSSSSSSSNGGELPSSRKTCVRIATPPELYCPAEGRDVFPNLFV